jgi:multimeric flavodoxin WrbA
MKVLAVCGSPRPQGNTSLMLKEALKVLAGHGIQTEYLSLHDRQILPCRACMQCAEDKNRCAQEDDFMPVYEAMAAADGLIVGSPVYFGSATPNLMALLDRAGYVARQGETFSPARWAAPSWWPGGPGSISPTPNSSFSSASWGWWCRAPLTGPSLTG